MVLQPWFRLWSLSSPVIVLYLSPVSCSWSQIHPDTGFITLLLSLHLNLVFVLCFGTQCLHFESVTNIHVSSTLDSDSLLDYTFSYYLSLPWLHLANCPHVWFPALLCYTVHSFSYIRFSLRHYSVKLAIDVWISACRQYMTQRLMLKDSAGKISLRSAGHSIECHS